MPWSCFMTFILPFKWYCKTKKNKIFSFPQFLSNWLTMWSQVSVNYLSPTLAFSLMAYRLQLQSNPSILLLIIPIFSFLLAFPTLLISQENYVFSHVNVKLSKVTEFESGHLGLKWEFWIDLFYEPFACFLSYPWNYQKSLPTPKFKTLNIFSVLLLESPTSTFMGCNSALLPALICKFTAWRFDSETIWFSLQIKSAFLIELKMDSDHQIGHVGWFCTYTVSSKSLWKSKLIQSKLIIQRSNLSQFSQLISVVGWDRFPELNQ